MPGDESDAYVTPDTVTVSPSQSPSAPPQADELPRGVTLGRYVILKRLGRGGMGVVYLAFDGELDRRVAIKVLRARAEGGRSVGGNRERLLREAQAMAKVSHPNVIAVHDVGTFGDEVFVAMEYVHGATLRTWRASAERSVREILAAYAQAGRGLEAAHAAGILHRDFKPENVLVDERGRVRVLDFGLARLDVEEAAKSQRSDADLALEDTGAHARAALETPLTRAGEVMGTPAYMPPEQLLGGRVTARSDQFSFCVALYEALYGHLPFEGSTVLSRSAAILEGKMRPEPRGARVPRGVRAALLRGMSGREEKRFASMGELLAALERAARGPGRWIAVGGVAACAMVVAGVVGARPARPALCRGADRVIAAAWGDEQRAAVAAGFDASGNPRAKDAWGRVRPILDDYARRWAAMSTESCEATHVRGVQSDEALDLRTACLDQRRAELSATVGALAGANVKLVDRAIDVALALSDLGRCADVAALRAPFAQPHDPAQRTKAASIRERIGRATALVNTQQFGQAGELASQAAYEAVAVGNRALEGAALLEQALAMGSDGRMVDALPIARRAALASNVARDDATEAAAWTDLVFLVGVTDGRTEDADGYAALADAAITRAGGSDALRSELARRQGDVLYARGRTREALERFRAARDLSARAWGPDAANTTRREADVADTEGDLGHLAEAIEGTEAAIAREAAVYGESPLLAIALYGLATDELMLGDGDAALHASERLLATGVAGTTRIHGSFTAARAKIVRGDVATGLAEGREAIAAYEAAYGATDWHAGAAREQLAETLFRRHLLDEADSFAARAIELLSGTSSEPETLVQARMVRAICGARRGRKDARAEREAQAAFTAAEKGTDAAPVDVLFPALALGETQLAAGELPQAAATLERAVAIAQTMEGYVELRADARFALARALVAANESLGRAGELAQAAAVDLDAAKLPDEAKAVRTWMSARKIEP